MSSSTMQLPLTWEQIVDLWSWCHEQREQNRLPRELECLSSALDAKMQAVVRRGLYSAYKTARTPAEREDARQRYLDEKGIPADFRWPEDFKPFE